MNDGTSALTEVGIHLTSDEARELIETLTDLLDDLERIGLPSTHSHLGDPPREIGIFVYLDEHDLETDFTSKLEENT